MKFIHAADLHVDSPLRGLDAYEGAPVARIRSATRLALMALVDLALSEQVDLVLLAGDIYDGNWPDFKTGLFFREQMVRLTKAGILVFIVKGNHDAESVITKSLPEAPGVHVFSARKAETVKLDALGVALHGRSFPEKAVTDDLMPGYPPALAGLFNIGLLHTSLTGRPGHNPYAPTTLAALCSKGYDYVALGHVHAREVVQEASPRIVFPGNLQGRDAGETGPKGCELVTVENGRIASAEHVSLDVVRWHRWALDTTGMQSLDDVAAGFQSLAAEHTAGLRDRLHAVRVSLHGESELARLEAAQPGSLAASLQAAAQDLDGVDVWIEKVQCSEVRLPLDRSLAAARPDAVGDVIRLVDELLADDAVLSAWARQALDDMKDLPRELSDAHPGQWDAAQWREALQAAEASVLAHLGSGASGAETDAGARP
ncbi:MAG: hypothetical protein RLZZ618_3089 [Pseudomonadota bacterium]